jgi:hypothetical protein
MVHYTKPIKFIYRYYIYRHAQSVFYRPLWQAQNLCKLIKINCTDILNGSAGIKIKLEIICNIEAKTYFYLSWQSNVFS